MNTSTTDLLLDINIDDKISATSSLKFLSVNLNPKLTWETFIICKRLVAVIYLNTTFKYYPNTVIANILRMMYYELVKFCLFYGITFWGGTCHLKSLFMYISKKTYKDY